MLIRNFKKGYALAELLVALSFLGLIVVFFTTSSTILGDVTNRSQNSSQANVLAREGLEVVRHLRDVDYANLSDGVFGLATSSSEWQFDSNSDNLGKFIREVTISSIDSDTKFVESKISWQDKSGTSTVVLYEYLTNWQKIIEDTVGDWSTSTVDVIQDYKKDGIEVSIVNDYAFIIMDGGNEGLISLDISDPLNPLLLDSLKVNGKPTDLYINGDYAFISGTGRELTVIDISNPNNLDLIDELNLDKNKDAQGVFVSGSYAYLTREYGKKDSYEFNIIDVSDPDSTGLVSGFDTSGVSFRDVYVLGNYAYVTASDSSGEIYIFNISNPNSPTLSSVFNIPGSQTGWSIIGTIDKLFFGSSNGNFYVIDSSNPNSLNILDSIDTGDQINDIDLGNSNSYAFIATDTSTAEFQVLDISNSNNISILGQNGTSTDALYGVAYSDENDFAIVVGDSKDSEVNFYFPGQ